MKDKTGKKETLVRLLSLHRKEIIIRLILLALLLLCGYILLCMRVCPKWEKRQIEVVTEAAMDSPLIDPEGMTQETRILPPEGYTRTEVAESSFTAFLRHQPLFPHGSLIYVHDGSAKSSACAAAVYTMDTGTANLQQCADSIIRLYSEYYRLQGMPDKIAFHTTSGFLLDYETWRSGKRALAFGEFVMWVKVRGYQDSDEQFLSYLSTVMRYAGTLSLERESKTIPAAKMRVGDFFCHGGSPGHVVLVVDEAINAQGEKCYLLGQGMMPAQSFHILYPQGDTADPWYKADEIRFPLRTGTGYVFQDESTLRRWNEGF